MNSIPAGSRVFLDTNILLYAIAEHPRFGFWCDGLLDRIHRGELAGHVSVIVLNELVHKLMIGEVAQKTGLKPGQVIPYVKRQSEILETLEAYEIVAQVEASYGLRILGVTSDSFQTARRLMQTHRLLSNDALHLAVMYEAGVRDLVTGDADFDGIEGIQVWKPHETI